MNIKKTYQEKTEFLSQIMAVTTAFVLPLSTTLTDIFFVLTVITSLAAGGWRDKFSFIIHNRIALMFLIFFALFVIGITYTVAPLHDAFYILKKYDKLLFAALLMPIFRDEKTRNYALDAFMAAMVLAVFASYLKALGILHYGDLYGPVEVRGHISFSFLMGITLYLTALKFLKVERVAYKILLAIFGALILYEMLFLGEARSGYFVLFGLVMLFWVQKMGWRGLLIGGAMVVLLAGISWFFSGMFKNKISDFHSDVATYHVNPQTSIGARMAFMANSWHLIKQHPVFGSGTGSFKTQYNNLPNVEKVRTTNPHDEYVHITVQLGALGLLILLSLFGMQLWYSRLLPRELRYIAQAVVIAIMIGCCANSWLLDTIPGHFYAFFMALTFAALPSRKY